MGFVTCSSSPIHHSFLYKSRSQSTFLFSSPVNGRSRRKNRVVIARLKLEGGKEDKFCNRRVILFVGFAVIPLLKTRGVSFQGLAAENTELQTLDQKQNSEGNSSRNPFLSFLNALGILGSGVLAALYASIRKEKAASDSTIKSLSANLKEKEAAITSLQEKFESELLNEKEVRNKALARANDEKQSLVNQLDLANSTIKSLGQDLQKRKTLLEEKNIQVAHLEMSLNNVTDEKWELQEQLKEKFDSIAALEGKINLLTSEIKEKEDNLKNVNSKLVEQQQELDLVSSVYKQAQDQISGLNLKIQCLKDEILTKEKELESKNMTINDLQSELTSSWADIDESNKKFNSVVKEHDQFKSSVEKKAALDAKLLGEREKEVHGLKEQLKVAFADVDKNKVLISDLTNERDDLKEKLNIEWEKVKNLEQELKITKESLEKSRDEASVLAKQLKESRNLCSKLEVEIPKIRADFGETIDSLKKEMDEAKQGAELLAGELRLSKELVSKSNRELQIMSKELTAAVQKRATLEKELVEAHKKAESAALELKEEKNIVSSLNKELKDLKTQLSKDRDARKKLETDLEGVAKSLDDMNQNKVMLSKDLEHMKSQVSSLEDEKRGLHKSLERQKEIAQEARVNFENAHNLATEVVKERDSLEVRGKKLEEQLASAKGEILRLKSQINSLNAQVKENGQDDEVKVNKQQQEKVEVGSKSASSKKVTRRKKGLPQREDS